jgi:dUTP pyrophosphatase
MPKRMVYLAYPLDNANLTEAKIAEINRVKRVLMEDYATVVVYDPGDAFAVAPGTRIGPEISAINNKALDTADAVFAWMPQGVSSIGVPMEIARAAMFGKPVVVMSDSWSWALAGAGDTVRVLPEDQINAAMAWLSEAEPGLKMDSPEPMPVIGDGRLPTRAHNDDAGLDLYVVEDTVLKWGQFTDVPCGVNIELPDWAWGLIIGRSSTFRRRQIEVQLGVIDAGWRGELFTACIWRPEGNYGTDFKVENETLVKAGERLAQLIVIPNGTKDVEPIRAQSLSKHERGDAGFGSSGA